MHLGWDGGVGHTGVSNLIMTRLMLALIDKQSLITSYLSLNALTVRVLLHLECLLAWIAINLLVASRAYGVHVASLAYVFLNLRLI